MATGSRSACRCVDGNRKLRVTGIANLVVGNFGGLTACRQSGANVIAAKMHVQRSPMMLGHCAALLVCSLLAAHVVALVPSFVPAGLLMFIGLSMLTDWLRNAVVICDETAQLI